MLLSIETTEAPAEADRAAVDDGLTHFNDGEAALADVRALCVFARDAGGKVVAGAVGRTWGACCELQQLWVDEGLRGQGHGRVLMAAFEHEAAARGCRLVYLDTFTFQAPGFYRKLGYETALMVEGFADGLSKLTMHKRLGTPPGR